MPYIDDAQVRHNIKRLAEYLVAPRPKFGVMFCGTCGNGKSTLMYAFANALNYLNNTDLFDEEKRAGRKMVLSIVDAKEVQNYAKDVSAFRELKNRNMLAIEDMGREATEVLDFGNILNPVIDLLEHRYNTQAFTLITTNLTAKEIRDKYGNRVADRLNEMIHVIIFENGTYRKLK